MAKKLALPILLVLILFLSACSIGDNVDKVSEGRILLWHTWSGSDEEALNQLLDNFQEIYPEIQVISTSYGADELQDQFALTVPRGLGPDLIIGSHQWTPQLVDDDLIQPLEEAKLDLSPYAEETLETLRYQGKLYGLPLSLHTSALYYNTNLVEEPAATLEVLLEHAKQGKKVALGTSFNAALWGVRAFGGQVLDDEGRVVLNQGGFANWLSWLAEAQNSPNMILSNDQEILRQLFTEGEAAYYVGSSLELAELRAALGKNAVGVAPLPAGPSDAAGPFLATEPLFFSTASSPVQTQRAMLLVEFLTNVEQQRKLARQTGRIPANTRVRINRRISPAVASFVDQSKTAVPMRLIPQMFETIERGEESYVEVLEGLTTPAEAAEELTKVVNRTYGFDTLVATTDTFCADSGSLEIWHEWTDRAAMALNRIGENYEAHCPNLDVRFVAVEAENLLSRYRQAIQRNEGPDLLLTNNQAILRLAREELVASIGDRITPEFLQRYMPNVPEALRYNDLLYGLPISLDTMALYYNTYLVDEPPADLNDLVQQLGPDHTLALPYMPFASAHWGISAFGGHLFDAEGNVNVSHEGFQEWLAWLQSVRNQPGFVLTNSQDEAEALFREGKAVYFVGEHSRLDGLRDDLGEQTIGVAPLPAGPEGPAGPLLTVHGLMLNPQSPNANAAMGFARYVTDLDSQTLLIQQADLLPANSAAAPETKPADAGFLQQAASAVVLPNRPEMLTLQTLGGTIYETVLEEQVDPEVVLADFTTFMTNTHHLDSSEEACTDKGTITLWHSLQGAQMAALDQIISSFARTCPDLLVEPVFVADDALANELAARTTVTGGQESASSQPPPDLILAAHDLVLPLSQERLIRPITSFVDRSMLIPFPGQALGALQVGEALYGLPYSLETTALFYNPQQVEIPGDSLHDLFDSATVTNSLAFDTSFEEAFWGSFAFGGNPSLLQQDVVDAKQLSLDLTQTSLAKWLELLQSVRSQPGVVFSSDQEKLKERFITGNASYLVTGSNALADLRLEMTQDDNLARVGVAPLPRGPNGGASPFLTVHGFLFGAEASEAQVELALRFAKFAVGASSQSLLVRQAHQVPSNLTALNLADDPAIEKMMASVRASIPLPPRPEMLLLRQLGDQLYRDVLKDNEQPTHAVSDFEETLTATPLPEIITYAGNQVLVCDNAGRLTFWHSWPFAAADRSANAIDLETSASGAQTNDVQADSGHIEGANIVDQMVAEFTERCPDVTVDVVYVPEEELQSKLLTAAETGTTPELFLADRSMMAALATENRIMPITDRVDETLLAQYLPVAVKAMYLGGELYGLPQSLDVSALYYNSSAISTTVTTLSELLANATPERSIGIGGGFRDAYWGIGTSGGPLFDGSGELRDESGLVPWLRWLQTAQEQPGIRIETDQEALRQSFAAGEMAYLVDSANALFPLRQALGEQVRVVPLPAGPAGEATPLLSVEGIFISPMHDEARLALALTFARFVIAQSNQQRFLQEAGLLPTHRLVAKGAKAPTTRVFIQQAVEDGVLLPAGLGDTVLQAGDSIYEQVLSRQLDPVEAVTLLRSSMAANFPDAR